MSDHHLSDEDAALARRAIDVLEGNWLGRSTRPSPRLYPHQWSWDSAFIAIGYAHYDATRAQAELLSLFRGQWSDGMLPHIVFDERASQSYEPGPGMWQTTRSPYAPRLPRTSGIIQPPVHATAAWRVHRHTTDRGEAREFLEDLLPPLAAWHAYLYRERTRDGVPLVEIWHPWESGMDNSPLWDEAMGRIDPDPGEVPDYRRADLAEAPAEERPTAWDYDRYLYLVSLFRERAYDPERIRQATPFAIWDVLYNSLLVQANRDLAEIARTVGAEPGRFEAWADGTARAIDERLWDDEHAQYVDHDLVEDMRIATRVGAGFAPLYAGVPSRERAERMVTALKTAGTRLDEETWAVPSISADDPRFRPTLYWRGPIWINVNWLLYHGLLRFGFTDEAERIRNAMVELPRAAGFWEHYDPTTGRGHGADRFSWTAALVLDLLFSPPDDD